MKRFNPQDFMEKEKIHLRYQLQQYEFDVPYHPNLIFFFPSIIFCFIQDLVKDGKSKYLLFG
jgi:hypothetical protein